MAKAPRVLTRLELNRALLARQMLLARETVAPLRAIERLVGLQAQIPRPPHIALWSRLKGFERETLNQLARKRRVVRATLLRGTIHLFTTRDYLAFRGTLRPALAQIARSVGGGIVRKLDLDSALAEARHMFAGKPRAFDDFRKALRERDPGAPDEAIAYAARYNLPVVQLPDESFWGYSGKAKFGLAEEWLGQSVPSAENPEAFVLRYLAGFGPAGVADAQTWSGMRGLKPVFEALRPRLLVFADERGRELFDLRSAPRPPAETEAPVRFLADYDNLILSHADRSRVIADGHRASTFAANGGLPVFLVDGFVAGTWRAATEKRSAELTVKPLIAISRAKKAELTGEGQAFLRFLEPDAKTCSVRFEPTG